MPSGPWLRGPAGFPPGGVVGVLVDVLGLAQLRCAFPCYAGASPQCLAGSDGEGEVVEGDAEPVSTRGLGGDVVVAAAQVLDEGMSCGEDPGGAGTLQAAHRPQPCLQPPVVRLDRVVRVPLNSVQGRGNQLVEDSRVGGCPLPDVAIGRSSPGAIADQWRTAGGDCHGRRQRDRHVRTPEEECDGRYQRAVARQDPGRARGPPAALRAITGTRRGCLAPIPRAGNPAP
jgi:hypothetical protein